jgi:hypothetical protein
MLNQIVGAHRANTRNNEKMLSMAMMVIIAATINHSPAVAQP